MTVQLQRNAQPAYAAHLIILMHLIHSSFHAWPRRTLTRHYLNTLPHRQA